MQFLTEDKKVKEIKADCEIIFVVNKNLDHRWIKDKDELKTLNFKGESEEAAFLPHVHRVYIGCQNTDPEEIRIATAKAITTLEKTSYETIKIGFYGEDIKPMIEGALFGEYRFDKYKSQKEKTVQKTLILSTENYDKEKETKKPFSQKEINEAITIASAANFAKDIVNTPPDDMTPKKLAKLAKKTAKKLKNVECFIGDKKFLKKEKMRAMLAVARASAHPPRLIHLKYKPKNPRKKIVFVGKGLTYDSGGLSLKPSEHMVTMKSDKSGGAAAIAILKAAAELNLPFEIHAIVGAVENMIGGNAYKPDDVLKTRSGKTVEVRNTDAEGRLVLADCLSYAQDEKPDFLIDLATLTGACMVALGEYTTGVMGHDSKLKHNFLTAASKSGELASTLPFNRYLKKLLKSSVADISNISSSRYGGAITAALFLDNFIKEEYKNKWLHLDIAGPAYVEKDWGYNKAGAGGAGVRMCLYWLKNLSEGEK